METRALLLEVNNQNEQLRAEISKKNEQLKTLLAEYKSAKNRLATITASLTKSEVSVHQSHRVVAEVAVVGGSHGGACRSLARGARGNRRTAPRRALLLSRAAREHE